MQKNKCFFIIFFIIILFFLLNLKTYAYSGVDEMTFNNTKYFFYFPDDMSDFTYTGFICIGGTTATSIYFLTDNYDFTISYYISGGRGTIYTRDVQYFNESNQYVSTSKSYHWVKYDLTRSSSEDYYVVKSSSKEEIYSSSFNFPFIVNYDNSSTQYVGYFWGSTFSIYKNTDFSDYNNGSITKVDPIYSGIKDTLIPTVTPGGTGEIVEIPTLQGATEIPEMIMKVLKTIIPVGLILLGISLTVYLIKSVICRVL